MPRLGRWSVSVMLALVSSACAPAPGLDASLEDAGDRDAARSDAGDASGARDAAPDDAAALDAGSADDAWVAPDAWTVGVDAACGSALGVTPILLHSVAPDPVVGGTRDLPRVHVHAESACGTDLQLETDATGHLALDLPDAAAPWDVTLALAGHAAVSILDITRIGFDGDVRLDPLLIPGSSVSHRAEGTVSGVGAGHRLSVDTYDSGTGTTATPPYFFYSTFYTGFIAPLPPLDFVALERDDAYPANLLNIGTAPSMMRPMTDLSGIVITMASPAPTPIVTQMTFVLPTTGVTSGGFASLAAQRANHTRFDLPFAPHVATALLDVRTPDPLVPTFDMRIQHFPGPLDVNRAGIGVGESGFQIDVSTTDIRDRTITIPPVTSLTSSGTTLDTLAAEASGDGYEALVLFLGEGSFTPPAHWRVIATASGGAARIDTIPHLPAAVSLADIGLDTASIDYVVRYITMETGRPWSTQVVKGEICCTLPGGPWQQAWAVGAPYQTVATTGR